VSTALSGHDNLSAAPKKIARSPLKDFFRSTTSFFAGKILAQRRAAKLAPSRSCCSKEDMVMRYDFSPLYRSTVGFDRLFDRQLDADAAPGWPPYDIEKVSEDSYRISLAVAGFATEEIELIQKENELTVTGRKDAKDGATQFLHRGIATRAFKQTFNLAEHVKVVEASQENGLLVISLKREIPEALKPRRIQITAGPAQPETQDNARDEADRIGRRAA
jgi:molecular chaperone IbpA